MKTIAGHFAGFSKAMGLEHAGPAQRADMRMAFYGGASVMLTLMTAIAAQGGSDDLGATRIEQLDAELREFARTLGRTPQ